MHAVQTVDVARLLAELAPETQPESKGSKPTRTGERMATPEEEALASELQNARASVKGWEAYAKRVQTALYSLMGTTRTLSRPGGGKVLQIDGADSETVDLKRLRTERPDLYAALAPYLKTREGGSYLRVTG